MEPDIQARTGMSYASLCLRITLATLPLHSGMASFFFLWRIISDIPHGVILRRSYGSACNKITVRQLPENRITIPE